MFLNFNSEVAKTIYGDVPTFLDKKFIKDPADLKGMDAVFLGIPYDGVATYRGGATRRAPQEIRKYSLLFSDYNLDFDETVTDYLSIGDMGDIDVICGEDKLSYDRAEVKLDQILDAGAVPFVIGGDHGVTIPVVNSIAKKRRSPFGIVIFDTHLDLGEEFRSQRFTRASPAKRHLDHPEVSPENMVIIGARGARNHKDQAEFARDNGITLFTIDEIDDMGIGEVCNRALEIATVNGVPPYISVDIDSLDCGAAPATNSPSPAGLSPRELVHGLKILSKNGFLGFDLVEVVPEFDTVAGQTSCLAASIYTTMLAALALSKKNRP